MINTIQLTDEMLEDCPTIKSVLFRMWWKSHWRNLRMEAKKLIFGANYYENLKAEGKPIFKHKKSPSYENDDFNEGL